MIKTITAHPLGVCLAVQEYLQNKYNIDFVTSRKKIFALAPRLKGKYENPNVVTCDQYAEDLYDLYLKEKHNGN